MSINHTMPLTWAGLLGHWMHLAQAALALPRDPQSEAWRASVPDIIALQAVWFALGQLAELPVAEQWVGLDRAGVLIDKHERALLGRFSTVTPESVRTLCADARQAYAAQHARLQALSHAPKPSDQTDSPPV